MEANHWNTLEIKTLKYEQRLSQEQKLLPPAHCANYKKRKSHAPMKTGSISSM